MWNTRFAYAFQEGRYEAAVFARNLLDRNYLTSAFPLSGFGFNEQMWGHPRTFGVEATAHFHGNSAQPVPHLIDAVAWGEAMTEQRTLASRGTKGARKRAESGSWPRWMQ